MLDPQGSSVSEMAKRARMTKQAMGEQVALLERRGYLQRTPHPGDRRAKLVSFTPKGWAAVQQAVAAVVELEARWAEHLGPRRARAFRRSLVDLCTAFGRDHIR